jgi:hypothetical protein
VPLAAMRLLAGLEALFAGRIRDYREPDGVCVLSGGEFGDLVEVTACSSWAAVPASTPAASG